MRRFINKTSANFSAMLFAFLICAPQISNALSISHIQDLNFGKAVKPSSGKVDIVVKKNGTLDNSSTTATVLGSSTISQGIDVITRAPSDPNDKIDIEITECGNVNGLKLKAFQARYRGTNFKNKKKNLTRPSLSGSELRYGATLVIRSFVTTGLLHPCYNVDVNFN